MEALISSIWLPIIFYYKIDKRHYVNLIFIKVWWKGYLYEWLIKCGKMLLRIMILEVNIVIDILLYNSENKLTKFPL